MFLITLLAYSVAAGQLPVQDTPTQHDEATTVRRRKLPMDMTLNPADYRFDSPDTNDLRYHLYIRGPRTIASEVWSGQKDALSSEHFNPNWPTKFVVHGFGLGTWNSPWVTDFVNAFFERYTTGVNVIMVDASSSFASLNYIWAAYNTQDVGYTLAKLLMKMEDALGTSLADKSHCIGHSLGAQACGRFGRTYDAFRGKKIAKITGLDAARPIFAKNQQLEDFSIRKSDAAYVEGVHTNAGIKDYDLWTTTVMSGYLGLARPFGHVSYYVNGGAQQPRCKGHLHGHGMDVKVTLDLANYSLECDHVRAYNYYVEAIKSPMYGQKCDNFDACYCTAGVECTDRRNRRRTPTNKEDAALGGDKRQEGLVFIRTSGDRSKGYRCSGTILIVRAAGVEEICEAEKCYNADKSDGFYDRSGKHKCNMKDGTPCSKETTCYNCANPSSFWNDYQRTKCGKEPCWGKDTMCYMWTCDSCCRGADHPWWAGGAGWCK